MATKPVETLSIEKMPKIKEERKPFQIVLNKSHFWTAFFSIIFASVITALAIYGQIATRISAKVNIGNLSKELHADRGRCGFADDAGGCYEDDIEIRSPLKVAHVYPDTTTQRSGDDAYSCPEMEDFRSLTVLGVLEIGFEPVVEVPLGHY